LNPKIRKLAAGCLYGQILRRREVANCILTETNVSGHLPPHAHENAYFCHVLHGTYTESYRQRNVVCEPSTVSFRPAGEVHEDWVHDNVRVFVLEINEICRERLSDLSFHIENAKEYRLSLLTELSVKLNREFHRTDTASSLALEGLLLEMLAEVCRQRSTKELSSLPRWLQLAHEIITDRYSENLSMPEIAGEVGVHPVHLVSTFKQKYGCTIGELVRRLRIEQARIQLSTGQESLTSIALSAGFSDHSHFSRTFKLYMGMTPSEYRRQANSPKQETNP